MGAFLVNFHVRASSIEQVSESLKQISVENAWIAGPRGEWISFWENRASMQDVNRIQSIAQHVSRVLEAPVIAFLVHDSDIFCYWLYDSGRQLDQHNSCPCYWEDDESVDEEALAGDSTVLAKYCKSGTTPSQLKDILTQWTRADRQAGVMPTFVFAEEGLTQLAGLLGLSKDFTTLDYNDFGRDIAPEELDAVWGGTGEPSDSIAAAEDRTETALRLAMPSTPLYDAVAAGDISAIKQLVANGVDINEIAGPYTATALAMAAGQATPATIRTLVELGADLDKKGPGGATPLRFAVQAGQPENIRALVELGADINEYDPQIGTLLHVAMICFTPECILTLLELGADAQRENPSGHTPLYCLQTLLKGLRQAQARAGGGTIAMLKDQICELEKIESALIERSK